METESVKKLTIRKNRVIIKKISDFYVFIYRTF